ncbi:MAG: lytic murein transglycosylase [Ectothiorhodospiraceae bacterium]
MPRSLRFLLSLSLLVGLPGLTGASDDAQRSFADRVAREHGLERDRVQGILDDAQHRDAIIEAISSPAEALPWHRYREIFVTDERAQEGAQFQARHAETLDRVAAEYGVDPDIITAILGIETRYGEHRGEHRVLDALVTLGFDYPPRASFFRDELEEFLVLAEAEGLDPRSVRGSYAGAMGIP